MQDFPKRLQQALATAGLTQKELADKTNISEVSISRYASGQRIPKSRELAKIAIALHTSCDYLLGLAVANPTDEQSADMIDKDDLLVRCRKKAEDWKKMRDNIMRELLEGKSPVANCELGAYAARQQEIYEYEVPRAIEEILEDMRQEE